METKFIDKEIRYDGTQLCSHFAYRNCGVSGDSVVAFAGPVDVKLAEMADIEDVLENRPISSDAMLSFIIEVFGSDLQGAVYLQRLFICVLMEELNRRLGGLKVTRSGDDLFYEERKLSVSIATASPVSRLVHAAVNIKAAGAPIPVSGLEEMKINPKEFALEVMDNFSREYADMQFARVKVNWVG